LSSTPVRILFISYYCHPQNLTATRNYYLSKFLAEAGFEVHIISKGFAGGSTSVKLKHHKIGAWDYRTVLTGLGVKDGVTSTLIPPGPWIQWGHKLLLRYPFNKWLGEGGGLYYLNAVKLGLKLVKEHQITHLYSSYRPMSDHFIAQQIKTNHPQLIWIGDFRDVLWWTRSNPHYQENWIRKLISGMDHITAVTKGIGSFWGEVFQRSVVTVYNGLPLEREGISAGKEGNDKFILNYTGSIYMEFQRADILFQLLKELTEKDKTFADDLSIRYSGINSRYWEGWMRKSGLLPYSRIQSQVPVLTAWEDQTRAHINILLTWATSDVSGFIHGKFNEYVAARKPILGVVDGVADPELEKIYAPLTNSLLVYHSTLYKEQMRDFIWRHYLQWKKTGDVELLPKEVLDLYQWEKKGLPLLQLINSPG
jgi:hypothetical protein